MTRACPYCAERIQNAARLCRFCGRPVDPVAGRSPFERRLVLNALLFALLVLLGIALLYAYRSQSPAA